MQYKHRLKEIRKMKEKSQQEIADFLKIKQTQYSRYETGKRDLPTKLILDLADYYGVTTDYLLGRADNKTALYSADDINNKPA